MLKKNKSTIQIDCKKINPPSSQPLVAVYEAHLDVFFNSNSECRLKSVAGQLTQHLSHIFVRETDKQYELVAGYRQFHLAEKLGVKSLTAVVIYDMSNEELFQFVVTDCVLPLLAFDTQRTTATNTQFRGFYNSLRENLNSDYAELLSDPGLIELLRIPRSHLREIIPPKQSALELQREQVSDRLNKKIDTANIMSKFSFRELQAPVKKPATEKGGWLDKVWIQYLSKEQADLLKVSLPETSKKLASEGDRYA